MPSRRYISSDSNTGAASGEKTTLDGTELFPISGNQVVSISTMKSFSVVIDSDSTHYYDGTGSFQAVKDAHLSFSDITTNNATTSVHGFLPKLGGDSLTFLNGDGEWATPIVSDSDILFTDITTGNSTTSNHGFLPKLGGDSNTWLNGDGEWTSPVGVGSVASDTIWDAKGDLAAATAADTAVRLALGADGQVLTVDSAETTGLKWATPGAGTNVATDTIWDAKGDLAVGTGSNTAARLAGGTDGQVLTYDSAESTGMKWAAASSWLYTTGTAVLVSSDSAETTVLSYSVPGGTLGTDDALHIKIQTRISHGIVGTLTVKLKYGSTTVLSIDVPEGALTVDKSSDIWFILAATGATNTQRASGRVDMQDVNNAIRTRWNQEGTAAEDSTGTLTLSVTVQWDTASGSLSYIQSWAGIEKMG